MTAARGSVADLFLEATRRDSDGPFLVGHERPGESCTFRGFLREATAIARCLTALGVRPGDAVALLSEARPRRCVALAGILLAGGVVVSLDELASDDEVALELRVTRPVLAVTSARQQRRAASSGLRAFVIEGDGQRAWEHVLAAAPDAPLPTPAAGEAPAVRVATSGGGGESRWVTLSHAQLLLASAALAEGGGWRRDDVLFVALPPSLALAMVAGVLLPLRVGLTSVAAEAATGTDVAAVTRDEGVTVLVGAPPVHAGLLAALEARVLQRPAPIRLVLRAARAVRRRSSGRLAAACARLLAPARALAGRRLRQLIVAGFEAPPSVVGGLRELGYSVGNAYGLTESCGLATWPRGRNSAGDDVGMPLPHAAVRIHSPGDEGVGEILVRGRFVAPRADLPSTVASGGWFATRDRGWLDAHGRLHLARRRDEVLHDAEGGEVPLVEIERHHEACPSVQEARAVVRPDGDGLHLVVVPDAEALHRGGVTLIREVLRFELENASLALPPSRRMRSFEIRRTPLARTPAGRLRRDSLTPSRPDAVEALAPDDAATASRLATDEGRRVRDLVSTLAGTRAVRGVTGRSSLELDLGLGSLDRVELLLAVEAAFGISISEADAGDVLTVDDLVRLVHARTADGVTHGEGDAATVAAVIGAASAADLPPWMPRSRGRASAWAHGAAMLASRLLSRAFLRLRVAGVEHVPRSGPVLLCPNHASFLDGVVVGCALPLARSREALALGEERYVSRPWSSRLSRFFRVLPVTAQSGVRDTLRQAAAGLGQGRLLLVFPEGVRTLDGSLGDLRLGAPLLAATLGVPIVPVAVMGTHEAWPRGRRLPRLGRVSVSFGRPITPRANPASTLATARAVAEELRRELLALGAHAPSPRR